MYEVDITDNVRATTGSDPGSLTVTVTSLRRVDSPFLVLGHVSVCGSDTVVNLPKLDFFPTARGVFRNNYRVIIKSVLGYSS